MADIVEEWISSVVGRQVKHLDQALANGYLLGDLLARLGVLSFRNDDTKEPNFYDTDRASASNFKALRSHILAYLSHVKDAGGLLDSVIAKDRLSGLILTEKIRQKVVNAKLVPKTRALQRKPTALMKRPEAGNEAFADALSHIKGKGNHHRQVLFRTKVFFDQGESLRAEGEKAENDRLEAKAKANRQVHASVIAKGHQAKENTDQLIKHVHDLWLRNERSILHAQRGYIYDERIKERKRDHIIQKLRDHETKELIEGTAAVDSNATNEQTELNGKLVADNEDFNDYMERLTRQVASINTSDVGEYLKGIKEKQQFRTKTIKAARNIRARRAQDEVELMRSEDAFAATARKNLIPIKPDEKQAKAALKEEEARLLAEVQLRRQELIDSARQAFIDGIDFKQSAKERYDELLRIRKTLRAKEKQEKETRLKKHTPICERIVSELLGLAMKIKAEGGTVDPSTWHDIQQQFVGHK
jgi:hypothetical protein